jgi:hypothetical protein
MGRMMEMMGKGGATGSPEHMGAMMEMMQGMGIEEMTKMMENCRQMTAAPPVVAPEKER